MIMKNRYKLRNFDHHHDDYIVPMPFTGLDTTVSDSIYEDNKGISHAFLHYPSSDDVSPVRLISDVEIAVGSDPAISSQFDNEYRSALRASLENQPRASRVPARSDDDLIAANVPNNLERDEALRYSKSALRGIESQLRDDLASVSVPNVESSNVESSNAE